MFDRVTRVRPGSQVLYVETFLTVHLPYCGVDSFYCFTVDNFVYHATVPVLEDLFRNLGDYHLYHGMFASTSVSVLNYFSMESKAWWVAYV